MSAELSTLKIQGLKRLNLWIDDSLSAREISQEVLRMIPEDKAAAHLLLPIGVKDGVLEVVTSASYKETTDRAKQIAADIGFDGDIDFYFCDKINLLGGLSKHYGRSTSSAAENKDFDLRGQLGESSAEEPTGEITESAISQHINSLIEKAIEWKASDIHLHPTPRGCKVFLRIDNRLVNITDEHNFDFGYAKRIVKAIKARCNVAMSTSDILPEDGLIAYPYAKGGNRRQVSCRVSTLPFIGGEKVVIRFLDTAKTAIDIERLGYGPEDIKLIKRSLHEPSGLYMVVGPVNTGKSTTLAAIRKIYDGNKYVTITVEDPVEYKDENIVQVEINPTDNDKTNYDYNVVARHVLRQDFNNLFIGEMRDAEVARQVASMSLYGRRIFTTLHGEDVLGSFGRLVDMGINLREFISQLRFVLSQRLIAVNCDKCLEQYKPEEDLLDCLPPSDREKLLDAGVRRSRGDKCCGNRGYKALTAVGEILYLDDDIRDEICKQQGVRTTLNYLQQEKGFKTMYQKAFDMVLKGETTLEELVQYIPRH